MSARGGDQQGVCAGTVVASHGRNCRVELDDGAAMMSCVTRGKRKDIVCGDRVTVLETGPEQGVVETIAARSSLFYRAEAHRTKPIAANVTRIILVVAAPPGIHEGFLDRCLVAAENAGVPALIVLNKTDLPSSTAAAALLERYRALGYDVLKLAAKHDISALRTRLTGHTSVLAGQSGAGKSTIINALVSGARARTGAISTALNSGRHTTTHAQLYRLDTESAVIDTPGMQEFGLAHLELQDIAYGFPEFRPYLGHCRFNDCRHVAEPGCALAGALAQGQISDTRLASYRKMAGPKNT